MDKYSDIIDLERPRSNRNKMSISERSFQFAPFAALVGYDECIKESERITNKKIELSPDDKLILDNKINYLINNINTYPQVKVTYFKKDIYKNGGVYLTKENNLKKIDLINKELIFINKEKIKINDISNIESDIFKNIINY